MEVVSDLSEEQVGRKDRVFRDVRRYFCEYCGICRLKKALIKSHVALRHKDELQGVDTDVNAEDNLPLQYTCEECGTSFKKPAYLKQHMQGHSLEYQDGGPPEKIHQASLHSRFRRIASLFFRPFHCPVDDCQLSYKRKDHLTRHLLCHQGKLFTCPFENCKGQFSYQSTMKRHVMELHDEESTSNDHPKLYACPEIYCGKVFKYPSKLKKHGKSHVKSSNIEVVCLEPGCMKYFTDKNCLKAHVKSCHMYVVCSVCGILHLKKNIKRHQRSHYGNSDFGKIKCSFDGCHHMFANMSNLNVHVKAVHLEERPFTCRISGCGKGFSFKHVRDKHESSGIHAYAPGDLLETDELFRLRPRGGRKRKCDSVDSLLRKRVAPPDENCILDDPRDYLRWLLGDDGE